MISTRGTRRSRKTSRSLELTAKTRSSSARRSTSRPPRPCCCLRTESVANRSAATTRQSLSLTPALTSTQSKPPGSPPFSGPTQDTVRADRAATARNDRRRNVSSVASTLWNPANLKAVRQGAGTSNRVASPSWKSRLTTTRSIRTTSSPMPKSQGKRCSPLKIQTRTQQISVRTDASASPRRDSRRYLESGRHAVCQ